MSRREEVLGRREMELADELAVLDETFEAMASDSDDAPDDVVATLMARPELLEPAGQEAVAPPSALPFARWIAPCLGWTRDLMQASSSTPAGRVALAAAATLMIAVALLVVVPRNVMKGPEPLHQQPRYQSMPRSEPPATGETEESVEGAGVLEGEAKKLRALGYVGGAADEDDRGHDDREYNASMDQIQSQVRALEKATSDLSSGPAADGRASEAEVPETFEEEIDVTGDIPVVELQTEVGSTVTLDDDSTDAPEDPWAVYGQVPGVQADRIHVGPRQEASEASGRFEDEKLEGKKKDAQRESSVDDEDGLRARNEEIERLDDSDPAAQAARRFLDERRRTSGHHFVEAAGYWSNPWIPGDPDLRFLAARMDELTTRLPAGLHRLSSRPSLPFDPPERDALAVYLHADRTVTDGPARVAVRVGVRAADAWAGRRTAMNLAVILHLPPEDREIPASTAASLRALLDALADAHDLGDRFHLFVAGRPGDLLVSAEEFRRGAVTVAARRLIDGTEDAYEPSTLEREGRDHPYRGRQKLGEMLWWAFDEVKVDPSAEDFERPVGSSAVLVVTTGDDTKALEGAMRTAHRMATDGVRVSALGLGHDAVAGEVPDLLRRLADAGQGSRRLVARPADAGRALEDELASAARAVARAVRLRIRPAPGVQLIDVFGSQRLEESAAERVREGEQALDRRLARKLGIEADRGDDEVGIQIVVPALYAGDAMTLLVDLVAPGPGPLVDVTVRYKDLVRLENGVARARLELAYGEPPEVPGAPLEVSVVESLLAHRVKDCLQQAADQLGAEPAVVSSQSVAPAVATLTGCRDLLWGMTREVPALADSPVVARDLVMLDGYLSALHGGPDSEARKALVQSLRYAGMLKTLPAPLLAGSDSEDDPRR